MLEVPNFSATASDVTTGGLTTKQAIFKLYKDIKCFLDETEKHQRSFQSWKHVLYMAFSRKSVYSTFRWTSIVFLILSIITYAFAYQYGHFTSSIPLAIETIILVLTLFTNTGIIFWNSRSRYVELYNKARKLNKRIQECSNNEELMKQWASGIFYAYLYTPTSPCITLQWTYRDGKLVNLPVSLLVCGDVILLNPGRQAPANCRRIETVMKRRKKLSDYQFENEQPEVHPLADSNSANNTMDHTFTYVFHQGESMKENTLSRGDVFFLKMDNEPESFTTPRLRKAVKSCKFLVTETPYIRDLKMALSLNRRSPTAFEKELRLIFVRYMEHILVPIILVLVLVFSIVHYCYIEFTGHHFDTGAATIALILLRPIMAILPLLPLALPLLWLILNVYGLIRMEIIYENFCQHEHKLLQPNECAANEWGSNDSNQANNQVFEKPIQREHFLEEIGPEKFDNIPTEKLMLKRTFLEIVSFFYNDNGNLWRTNNLLHVLGSITALCFIDKKGILSLPNPTADKVFFLTSPTSNSTSKKNSAENPESNQLENDEKNLEKAPNHETKSPRNSIRRQSLLSNCGFRAECVQLDVTNDRHNAYGLQFDDIYWSRYLSNLKPLGLAILLNTCNQYTQENYVQFSDHIACESLNNEVAVPVASKRCLCELARQIGFKQNAIKDYEYCHQIGIFRNIRPEVIQKGRLAKSLNFPRLKIPFPNMTCAVIKDGFSKGCQLFSQGTGDLILDTCAEYWNGQSLVTLNDYERKKIFDFYQRSALTSYCCAFAYIPIVNEGGGMVNQINIPANFYSDYYVEFPSEFSHLFPNPRSLDANIRGLGIDSHYFSNITSHNLDANFASQNESYANSLFLTVNSKLNTHHLSSDSLNKHETFESGDVEPKNNELSSSVSAVPNLNDRKSATKMRASISPSCDSVASSQKLEQIVQKTINEVFIGMITLQYQACMDFVKLVELLDSACIRFVHFSKENELRSRVFSQKMGLESGWNCHISLLNENNPQNDVDSSASSEHRKSKQNITESLTFAKNKSIRTSISSASSSNSLLENNKDYDSDEEQAVEVEDSAKKRKKQNSVSSDRSETIINMRYIKNKENRSSSKCSVGNQSMSRERNLSPSPSRHTTASTMTEHSAPIAFDMSNRAKLPKGIDNIRPHLTNVDNVPLLVSLFTDCTPAAAKEMIEIMQEYEEVVCVVGSMANESNIPIFLQADASIGVEPMYPHMCITEPVRPIEMMTTHYGSSLMSPNDLANQLIALPCSMTMQRHNAIIFYHLILIARDYMMRMRNIFQFFLSSCLSLILAQMFTSLAFLPPLFSPGIVLWLSLIVIPFLSVSLMGIKPDPIVMNVCTGKRLHLNKKTIVYFFICSIIKFTPSILICVIMFAIIIGTSCEQTKVGRSTLGPCWMFSDVKADGDIKTDLIWSSHLLIGQTIASFFLVLYLVIISFGFVHRNHLFWQRCPFTNLCWLITSIVLIIFHILVCFIEIYIYVPEAEITEHFLQIIPFYIWIIGFLWPICLMAINMLTKRREIKMNLRQQRLARLEFHTKLGMNSPF